MNIERPQSPYVGLAPFSEKDAPFFFGREREREIITANLRAARLTLLYGPSGVGKSSVLRAGVIHQLRQLARQELEEYGMPSFAVVYHKSWAADTTRTEDSQTNDPIRGIADSIHQAIADAFNDRSLEPPPLSASRDLTKLISAWQERFNLELLIILDQFEEYFLYRSNEESEGTFAAEFPKLVNRLDLPVRFLLSMREDSISKVDKFKGKIPILFDNRLQIEHMGVEAGREAIEKPVAVYNQLFQTQESKYELETGLTDEVLRDKIAIGITGQGKAQNDDSQSRIQAPYLQLVMTRIWEEEQKMNSTKLRRETFLKKLGGATTILRTHLDAAMGQLPAYDQSVAAEFFHYLVTPVGTKMAQTTSSLSIYTKLSEKKLTPVLERLSSSKGRILNPVSIQVGEKQQPGYEVYHDALAPAILDWRLRYKNRVTRLWTYSALAVLCVLFLALGFYAYQKKGEVSQEQVAEIEESAKKEAAVQINEVKIELGETTEELKTTENLLTGTQKVIDENSDYELLFKALVGLGSDDADVKNEALSQLEELAKKGGIPEVIKPLISETARKESPAIAEQIQKALVIVANPRAIEERYKQLPPRVYIHISDESQREKAKEVEKFLEANGYVVPGIQHVTAVKLSSNELRCFRADKEEVELGQRAVEILAKFGVKNVKLNVQDWGSRAHGIRPKHYELWFKTGALLADTFLPSKELPIRKQ